MLYTSQINGSINGQLSLSQQNSIMNLSVAILNILHKSLPEMTEIRLPVYNFFAFSNDSEHLQYFKDLIDVTLKDLTIDISVRVGLNLPLYTDRERHDAVLFVDSIDAMNFIYEEFQRYHTKGNFFYLIILHTFNDYFYDELLEILEINWLIGTPQFNVMVHALWNSILLYTIYPYSEYHCEGMAPALVNRFDGQKWQYQQDSFFPIRIGNLHGCHLTCATWEDMPYLEIIGNELIGIEGRLLEYIAEGLNFKLQIRYMNEHEIEQTVIDINGVLSELFSNRTDFVVGAFRYRTPSDENAFAATNAYYLSDLYLVVNADREPYSAIAKLLFPFSHEIWILLLLTFLTSILISAIIVRRKYFIRSLVLGSQNTTPIYNLFVTALGGSIVKPPRRNFARFLLLMWLFLALVLRNSYQGYLYHYIRLDVAKPPPNTIKEVLAQNYKIYMTENIYDAITELPELKAVARLLNGTEKDNFNRLSTSSEKIAILTPLEYYDYYRRLEKKKPHIHLVKERVLTQQLSIYMRKNSVMLRRFNLQIENYLYFGLIDRYEKLFQANFLGQEKYQTETDVENSDTDAKKMRLKELKGALGLLFAGYFMSGFTFVIEKIIFKIKRR